MPVEKRVFRLDSMERACRFGTGMFSHLAIPWSQLGLLVRCTFWDKWRPKGRGLLSGPLLCRPRQANGQPIRPTAAHADIAVHGAPTCALNRSMSCSAQHFGLLSLTDDPLSDCQAGEQAPRSTTLGKPSCPRPQT